MQIPVWVGFGEQAVGNKGIASGHENHALSANGGEFAGGMATSRVNGAFGGGMIPLQQFGERWMAGNEEIASDAKITCCRQTTQNLRTGWRPIE